MRSEELWELAVSGASLAEQQAAIADSLRDRGLRPPVVAAIENELLPGALLRPRLGGTSRAGGGFPPLVEEGWQWPESSWGRLAFLAEVRLDDLIGGAALGLAATRGSLLFFHDETPGLDELWLESTHVTFVPADAEVVVAEGAGEFQSDATCPLAGFAMPLVALDDDRLDRLDDFQHGDAYTPMNEVLRYQGQGWRFLGAGDSEPAAKEAIRRWFATTESDVDRKTFSPAERDGRGWRSLLTVRDLSDDASGLQMSWPGSLNFCIPEVDLAAWKFDRVITFLGNR